ncbi:DUF3519 domain-containing protein [Helicobacter pylori]|nr:DUF3519 domain-containing protein [Helicobacter pylori]
MGHSLTITEMASTIASQTLTNLLTQKPLTSQEDLLKTQENTQKTTQEPLSPLEQANAEKLAKLESERIESEKEFLTSYQIFLNNAKESANNQISETKTQALNNITEAKENATTQINTNKTESLEAIGQPKRAS